MTYGQRLIVRVALALVACLCLYRESGSADEEGRRRLVPLVVFLSSQCGHCEPVERPALSKLGKELKVDIRPTYVDVDKTENYLRLVSIEKLMGKQSQDLPVVLVGSRMIGGIPAIKKTFRSAVEDAIRTDGKWSAAVESILRKGAPADAIAISTNKVYAVYFTLPVCAHCGRPDHVVKNLKTSLPNLKVRTYLAQDATTRILQEVVEERVGVPRKKRGIRPRLVIGRRCLTLREITDANAFKIASKHKTSELPPWVVSDSERVAALERLGKWFDTLTLSAMVISGLIDGINPCAFAVIVFFISYLAALGTARREVLSIGVSFISAIFVTYLLIGLGLSELLGILSKLPWLARLVSYLVAGLALLLSAGSFYDAYLVRSGKPREILLQLPKAIKRRINVVLARRVGGAHRAGTADASRIHESASFPLLPIMIAAVTSGVIVSLLELACTGQVYLPAIRMMLFDASGRRLRAAGYLVVYNVAFIVPLVGVFLLAYAGVTSDQLRAWLNRHLGLTKLAMGTLFLLLAGAIVIIETL